MIVFVFFFNDFAYKGIGIQRQTLLMKTTQ